MAAIFLVSSHSTIVLLGADRQYRGIMDILLTGNFIRVFCLRIPSVTSSYNHHRNVFSSTTVRITENFRLRNFEHCK